MHKIMLSGVVGHSRHVAKNFQVGVLSLRILGPGESEARRVEENGVLGEGFTPPHQLGGQGSAVKLPQHGLKMRLGCPAEIEFSAF